MQIESEAKTGMQIEIDTPAVRQQILRQLSRIVSHDAFRHSKRSARLLEYLVRETLAGHAEWLKERRIGVEVFGRPADYDSNADPIVRSAASEIRRRLAQYYQESTEPQIVHFRLQQGSYCPLFEPICRTNGSGTAPATGASIATASIEDIVKNETTTATVSSLPAAGMPAESLRWRRLNSGVPVFFIVLAAGLLLLAVGGRYALDAWKEATNPVDRFWRPVVHSQTAAVILVGAVDLKNDKAVNAPFNTEFAEQVNGLRDPAIETDIETRPVVMLQESEISSRVAQLLTERHKRFQLRAANSATLSDLRSGPAILLGIIDNPWALRILPKLRFHPRLDAVTQQMWIEDSEHPERKDWSVRWGIPYSNSYSEYALITRCRDPLSGQPVMEIGGLGLHGTQAAGEFVADSDALARLSPAIGDPDVNVQVVLSIAVVNGAVAPAHVLAVHFWK